MPLPLVFVAVASVLGATGVGASVLGAKKIINAHFQNKKLLERVKDKEQKFEQISVRTSTKLDQLGKRELEVMESFKVFSELIEQIHNRPEFKKYEKDGMVLPTYNKEELQKAWVGASTLLAGVGGAAIGSFGGFAAAGATTAAIMALGTSSTGVAISTLNGAAAINATLALLGGGSLATGGGGMALGAMVLSGVTAGMGIFIGGIIFHLAGKKILSDIKKMEKDIIEMEQSVDEICSHLEELCTLSVDYFTALQKVDAIYQCHLEKVANIIYRKQKTNWNEYTTDEKREVETTTLLAGLLYKMCQVPLTIKGDEKEINLANTEEINKMIDVSNHYLLEVD